MVSLPIRVNYSSLIIFVGGVEINFGPQFFLRYGTYHSNRETGTQLLLTPSSFPSSEVIQMFWQPDQFSWYLLARYHSPFHVLGVADQLAGMIRLWLCVFQLAVLGIFRSWLLPAGVGIWYLVFVFGVMGKFYLVNWSRGQGGREDCNYRLSDASRDYLRALLFSLPESSALRSRSSTSLNLFTAPGDHTFCYDCGVDDYFDNYDEFDDEPLSVYRWHRVIVNGYVW